MLGRYVGEAALDGKPSTAAMAVVLLAAAAWRGAMIGGFGGAMGGAMGAHASLLGSMIRSRYRRVSDTTQPMLST